MRGFRKVEDIKLSEGMSVDALINAYSASGGFTAKKLAVAVDILSDMLSDEASVNFLSFFLRFFSLCLRILARFFFLDTPIAETLGFKDI